MRLLDSSSLRLVNKREGDIPAYAILSHTWGSEDEEVSFQDIHELSVSRIRQPNGLFAHRVAKKAGFAKIRDAALLAKSQGYQFIWIDTCCIDKTSSAELSEAINSMFRWYRDAAICYTFLNDVDDSIYTMGTNLPVSDLRHSIRVSRWFTRGWTLQELIAPANVYFYSQNWNLLGDRSGLLHLQSGFPELLSDITGIDAGVLSGSIVLDDLSVATKMKWAANRQTTRTEDIAYCLMGIFNVNMPLLYGEGQRAFMRLQEEILKVTNDQSIFAWKCPENDMLRFQLSGLLASSPAYFESLGDIKPMPLDPSRASAPSTMTNAGLHVQLFLQRTTGGLQENAPLDANQRGDGGSTDEYYAILDCYPRTTRINGILGYHNLAIRLVALGGDQYARLNSQMVYWVPSAPIRREDRGTNSKYIYVKQVTTYGLPDIVVSHIEGHQGSHYIGLVDVYPRKSWSDQTRTLKPETSAHNSVLGVFRYAIQPIGSEPVFTDIYVGISPEQQGPLSWRCWCFQLSARDRSFPKLHPSVIGNDAELGHLRLSHRHDHRGIFAAVETVRLRSKIYISLDISGIQELDANYKITPPRDLSLQAYELNAEEETNGELLALVAESPVTEDTWQPNIGLGEEKNGQIGTPRIRVLSRESTDSHGEPTRESFSHMVSRAAECNLTIENRGRSEEAMFQNYFSLRLAQACIKNDTDGITQILESPLSAARVEVRTSIMADTPEPWHRVFNGFRPLHWASALGHVDVVKLLAKYNIDTGSITDSGFSAVHLAILSDRLEVLNYLLEGNNHPAPQWLSAYYGGEKPAHLAASYIRSENSDEALSKVIFSGTPAPPDVNDHSTSGADLENFAIDGEVPQFYRRLKVKGDLALNRRHETPLHRAAAMDNIHAARCIISRSIEQPLCSGDSSGRSPLWHAAAAGAIEIIKLFIEYGVNIDAPDNLGRTPLHAACRMGHEAVVEELIQAGADISAFTKDTGFTVCHFATLGDHANILRILLKHGATRNCHTDESVPRVAPIHIAAANGFLDCAKVLFEAGCDIKSKSDYRIIVNSPNPSGVMVTKFKSRTPADLADIGSHSATAALLHFNDLNQDNS